MMKRYRFDTKRLQVIFEDSVLDKFQSSTQRYSRDHERGGLLLGRIFPDENKIVVVEATNPAILSSDPTNICVDLEDANAYMLRRWEESDKKITYIGDWHTHPEKNPSPSLMDKFTFFDTYRKSHIDQNLLLCAIIGTNPSLKNGIWLGAQSKFELHRLHRTMHNHKFYSK